MIAVRYPSAHAFLALALVPEIAEIAEIGAAPTHRDAGLKRATLIRCDDFPR